ncbi:glycosyltransferase family 4 protein [Microbacterium aquimaris]|uniref:glycosyltransferase family 4 protein n=1 Tax=Microbacterium aquimaris TaxID=459816 RepID=UPI002AD4133F|nr:glycosyltransferase family 4 protein [Microbacterium aquimaris]MDZ8274822.1 glycosyltransferase family 4 protein [Microbacterium aquimaris]
MSVVKEVWIVSRSVSFGDGTGGLERAVATQATLLADNGWKVTVVCPRQLASEPTPAGISVLGVDWPRFARRPGAPGFGLAFAVWARRVRKTLMVSMPQSASLYVHGGGAGVLRRLRPWPARAVANPHGMEEFRRAGLARETNRVFARYLARGARLADSVLATDSGLVEVVQKNLRVSRSQVSIIPNGVDLAYLDRTAHAGKDSAIFADIVSVGRMTYNKGYDLLAEALAGLEDFAPVSWVHFGDGPAKNDVVSSVAASQNVRLRVIAGAPDETVQASIARSRVFVQPSRYEGSSLTTLEAMSRGSVCVGTPVGGIPEKILDGLTGYLAASATATDIADAVRRALADQGTTGSAARALVQQKYDLANIAERLSMELAPRSKPTVVQVARHIGQGAGVAQVVQSLEASFKKAGVETRRITLQNSGLRSRRQITRSLSGKLALLFEVIWFSAWGTLAIRRARKQQPGAYFLVHGDPIGGDVYVNHGLLKEVMRQRWASRRSLPANPMHWFTLARDEVRYRNRLQGRIVCLNDDDAKTLDCLYGKVPTPVSVIPNGVDLDKFGNVDASERHRIRESIGIRDESYVLLFIGHEYERKGLFIALEAMPALSRDCVLLVVGGSPEMVEHARGRATALGVVARTVFVGPVDNPEAYYAASDILLLPTAYETGPLVLLEALAAGLPAVITRTGIAPAVVTPGVNGQLVDRDSASVADGVKATLGLLTSDRHRTIATVKDSARGYGWDAIAQQYLELLVTSRQNQ